MGFKVLRAHDLDDLWYKVTRWHLYKQEVDLYLSIGTNLENVILEAEGMTYDQFDMGKDLWLTKVRWTNLIRDYLHPQETAAFVARARDVLYNRGGSGVITNMAFRGVHRRVDRHRWGNCLMAVTFRGSDVGNSTVRPTLTVHSRVSYNAYILGLDLALLHVLAREIAKDPTRVRFQWHLDVMQTHSFKSLPYIFSQPDLMGVLVDGQINEPEFREKYPTWKSIARWWDNLQKLEASGKTLEEEKYGPYKRIRRRYQEYQRGEYQPSVGVADLDFSKLEGYYEALRDF